jgi:clan AA aspartic protease
MGTFTVSLQVGDLTGRRFTQVEALVDTGASDTMLPADVLARLGLEPVEQLPYQLADDRIVNYGVGEARVRLDGRERTIPVVFGPVGVMPLLGSTALEIFHLGVDPVQQRLIPVRGLLK